MELETNYRRPSRLMLPMVVAAAASPLLLVVATSIEHSSRTLANVVGIASLLGMVGAFVGLIVAAMKTSRRGRIVFGPEGVRLGDELVPRAEIATGVLIPASQQSEARVELRSKRDTMLAQIDVRNAQQGHEVLRTLGLGAADTVARFTCMTPPDSFTSNVSRVLVVLGALLAVAVFVVW